MRAAVKRFIHVYQLLRNISLFIEYLIIFCNLRDFVPLVDLDECLVPKVLGATTAAWGKQNQSQC